MTPELPDIDPLIELRHLLHQEAEVSNKEEQTAQVIYDFMQQYEPDQIHTEVGGYGVLAVFDGQKEGPTLVFRAELDALPIPERNDLPYLSKNKQTGHKCGHDGHMTMVAGLAPWLQKIRPQRGRVIIMFQPAEESGEGAEQIIESDAFQQFAPDYMFAIHNLPGFPLGQVVLRNEHFASASKGMINKLVGETSHAAEPENGNSPALAISHIIQQITALPKQHNFSDFTLATVIHARLGEIAFGTTPGVGEVMATLRSYRNADMEVLTDNAEQIVKEQAEQQDLELDISYREEFPPTKNDDKCVEVVRQVASQLGYDQYELQEPFRWSEDFGHFTEKYEGVLFGLGSGEEQPQLHNSHYDFPDDLIPFGLSIYQTIIDNLLNSSD